MKIAYLDVSPDIFENYSLAPESYGGGQSWPSKMKELSGFHIYAYPRCFEHLKSFDNKENCFTLTHSREEVINGAEKRLNDYDLIITPHCKIGVNGYKPKVVPWLLGLEDQVHPQYKEIILYNTYQQEKCSPDTKKHYFTLGVELPRFKTYDKEEYVFICARACHEMATIEVAQFCLSNKIKCILAGPVVRGYPLMDYVDHFWVKYKGVISFEERVNYQQKAKLYACIHNWNTPFNLSAIEALSYGTPVVSTTVGFWPSLIKNGVNGFYAHNPEQLLKAWNEASSIKQIDCYESVIPYNHFSMMTSLKKCFNDILK